MKEDKEPTLIEECGALGFVLATPFWILLGLFAFGFLWVKELVDTEVDKP